MPAGTHSKAKKIGSTRKGFEQDKKDTNFVEGTSTIGKENKKKKKGGPSPPMPEKLSPMRRPNKTQKEKAMEENHQRRKCQEIERNLKRIKENCLSVEN